jgi:cytochrome c553
LCVPAFGQRTIPKVWNAEGLQSMTLPVVGLKTPAQYAPEDWYSRIPERTIYRGYPVYEHGKEPSNYLEWVRAQPPEVAFDASALTKDSDWVLAGEAVFSAPTGFGLLTPEEMQDPRTWKRFGFVADYEGSLPGWRYVVRKRGLIEVASTLCGSCHESVVDSRTVTGAANLAANGALVGYAIRKTLKEARDWEAAGKDEVARQFALFSVPWLSPDPAEPIAGLSPVQMLEAYDTITGGVAARPGTSLVFPPRIPDLIGVADRKNFGATGLHRNRGVEDLMRRAILESGMDRYSQYGDFRPGGPLPDPAKLERLSDAQAYALAQFLYSLKPPPNPNRPDKVTKKGQAIFEREGCAECHPGPTYTTDKLVAPDALGLDPRLTTATRIGTGLYRVPSLKGLWYREPLEHGGALATIEDWFDPVRLRDDYVPTGFKAYRVEKRPVRGHAFALKLSFEDRRTLMAFLRTL